MMLSYSNLCRMALPVVAVWLLLAAPAQAARDIAGELAEVRQEKIEVERVRQKLQQQLGQLGQELRALDEALVEARRARREIAVKVEAVELRLNTLMQQKKDLMDKVEVLRENMVQASIAAWKRSGRKPAWLDALAGTSITDIPHQQYLLQAILQSQDAEREQWQQAVAKLAEVLEQERIHRDELAVLLQTRRQREAEVAARLNDKKKLEASVRRDAGLKKQRARQLALQEKALLDLLAHLDEQLLAIDKVEKARPVRKLKGHLPWPLKGRIVASFASRPSKGQSALAGVQMAPKGKSTSARKVKAMAAGQVRYADWFGGFGLMMIVDHGDGLMSVYAHNDALYHRLGDWVEAGEVLADAGSTGWVDEIRLYFEIRDKGKAVNPARWCR